MGLVYAQVADRPDIKPKLIRIECEDCDAYIEPNTEIISTDWAIFYTEDTRVYPPIRSKEYYCPEHAYSF